MSAKHAKVLDEQNGNQLWKEAMDKELCAMDEWVGVLEKDLVGTSQGWSFCLPHGRWTLRETTLFEWCRGNHRWFLTLSGALQAQPLEVSSSTSRGSSLTLDFWSVESRESVLASGAGRGSYFPGFLGKKYYQNLYTRILTQITNRTKGYTNILPPTKIQKQ